MLRLYYHHTPNPMKIALFLEEAQHPYELVPVDTFKGEQHTPEFRKINPNGKVPAIVDGDVTVFDSTAILLYLGEKTGKFMGEPKDRGALLSWLMFVATGVGPYSGQAVHFQFGAPERIDYAVNRYRREAERHYKILDERLAGREFIVGDRLTIADISAWGWIDRAGRVLGEGALAAYPNLKRWFDAINARPTVAKVREKTAAIPFKKDMDDETRRALFPTNYAA